MLAWDAWERRHGEPKYASIRDRILAVLGAAAFFGWWNLGAFHFGGNYIHLHEFFHYYLGAKYSHELGYTRLYDCVATVEIEQGHRTDVERRWIRDLTNNELKRGSPALLDPLSCRSHFSDDRWGAFSHDVRWFHDAVSPEKWLEMAADHGYNASPVWNMVGGLLASTGPVSWWQLRAIALIDPVLLVIMWAVVWWAFGWRVMCVALLWWGTNFPARFTFIGGAFLRQDWLLLTVAGIALARRQRPAASGFALAWASLLRVFPMTLVAGLGVKALLDLRDRRTWRPATAHLRFAAGFAAALVLLVGSSLIAAGGVRSGAASWVGFEQNTLKHASSRAANHLGLKALVSFDANTRMVVMRKYWLDAPWDTWIEARERTFQDRRILFWSVGIIFVGAWCFAVRRQPDWIALVLGAALIPILLDVANYYYGFLLVFAFLWPDVPLAGFGLCLVSVLSSVVAAVLPMEDDRSVATSLLLILFVCLMLVSARRTRQSDPTPVLAD